MAERERGHAERGDVDGRDVEGGFAEAGVSALVSGRVQGVGFRHYARREARRLGLVGWVRNLDDGRVEVWIEGSRRSADAMLHWLREGPPTARVERLEVAEREPEGHAEFRVERSGGAL